MIRTLGLLLLVAILGLGSRMLFLNQSLPSLLMGRKPGSAKPGTVLVRAAPTKPATTNLTTAIPSSIPAPDAEGVIKLKFDVLTSWKYVEGKTPIPENVQGLNGKTVELSGFMMPINETENITHFILVNSLWGCCFGQAPAVNHVIAVTMEPGKTVAFYPDPIKVTGRFFVGETREEGYLISVFRMEGIKVVVK